ncbi:Synaptonemal complex protein 2-like, partial [Dissostichus eleginoides]
SSHLSCSAPCCRTGELLLLSGVSVTLSCSAPCCRTGELLLLSGVSVTLSCSAPCCRTAPPAAGQLQVQLEDCVERADSSSLVSLLQEDLSSFSLASLHQLVTTDLCVSRVSRVSVVMESLDVLSENRNDLQTLLSLGLTAKVGQWFEALLGLLTSDPRRTSPPLLSLTEQFYDFFQLAGFSLETGIIFHLRLEAIRTLNSILESLSREQRRRVSAGSSSSDYYELQVSLSEALCRLTPMKERRLRANQWFPNRDISSSFSFLDSTELFPPKDDKLDEFWIDFNVGSECVSFFIDEPQGFLWGSFHLQQEEVDLYSLKECGGAEVVLSVRLKFPIMHRDSPGQVVQLRFDSEHLSKLQQAMWRVFMVNQGLLLFDQIFHSSPQHSSGLPEGAELQTSQVQKDMFGGDLSFIPKEGFGSGRKRSSLDSGCLSDQTEGPLGKTRREEPEAKGEEPVSEGEGVDGEEPVSEGEEPEREEPEPEGEEPEREEPEPEGEEPEGEEPNSLQTESSPEGAGPVMGAELVGGAESGSHLTSDITAAFNTFNSQLEHHFTGCWKNVETEILQSLTTCQQHVSSLLTAVHQHRFQSSVTDQLKSLHDDSNRLTSINTQTLNFFQTEMQQLGSFYLKLDLKRPGPLRPENIHIKSFWTLEVLVPQSGL